MKRFVLFLAATSALAQTVDSTVTTTLAKPGRYTLAAAVTLAQAASVAAEEPLTVQMTFNGIPGGEAIQTTTSGSNAITPHLVENGTYPGGVVVGVRITGAGTVTHTEITQRFFPPQKAQRPPE